MTLYRANPADGVAWLTGGSSGIGRELAKELAAAGYRVAVTAREGDPIDMLVAEAARLAGDIIPYPCDVTDEKQMAATVATIEDNIGPITLAIFNAGSFTPIAGENLSVRKFRRSFDVNVFGIVHGLVPVVRRMQTRGRGHVMFVGSISAYFGWPTTSAYGATKAAINVMAQALKFDFDKINIRIQVANPGFVDTPLLQEKGIRLPATISSSTAARKIMRGLRSGGFEIAFPRRLVWGLKFLAMMPQPVCHWMIARLTGWKTRSLSFGRKGPPH